MTHQKTIWLVTSALLVALLAGAYRIVRFNDAAMASPKPGQATSFYGH